MVLKKHHHSKCIHVGEISCELKKYRSWSTTALESDLQMIGVSEVQKAQMIAHSSQVYELRARWNTGPACTSDPLSSTIAKAPHVSQKRSQFSQLPSVHRSFGELAELCSQVLTGICAVSKVWRRHAAWERLHSTIPSNLKFGPSPCGSIGRESA